jgi:hypothetical protein
MNTDKKMNADKKIKEIKYLGKEGEFINGVPPRELAVEEWETMSEEMRKACLESGLYKISYE